jgi:succinate dehydrogenase / fumarate reductase, iron-sulfur subunit
MKINLYVWRQRKSSEEGVFKRYELDKVSADMSFLEMLDLLNEELVSKGEEPVAFEHDCREGICGSCSMMINGQAHGPQKRTTACQFHMRSFADGDTIYVEPWRARAFPILRDLVVDRGSLDRVIQAGGYISVNTGAAPEANAIPIQKSVADDAFDAATCIGCGACVAACPNGSAMLFTGAKISHLGLLAQGQPERYQRVIAMVDAMDAEGFGGCTNHGECQEACPKGISLINIGRLNRDYIAATLAGYGDTRTDRGSMQSQ